MKILEIKYDQEHSRSHTLMILNHGAFKSLKEDPLPDVTKITYDLIAKLMGRGAYQQDCFDENGKRIAADRAYFDDDHETHSYYTAGFMHDPKPGFPALQVFDEDGQKEMIMHFPNGRGLCDPAPDVSAVQHFDENGKITKSVSHPTEDPEGLSQEERDEITADMKDNNRKSTAEFELPDILKPFEIFHLKPAWS